MSQSNHDEAEDILQEAFIKIWKNLNGYDPRLKLSESWIFRIVHNETISYWLKTSYSKDNIVRLMTKDCIHSWQQKTWMKWAGESFFRIIEEVLPLLKQEYKHWNLNTWKIKAI
ncbi:MAG: hypothetical protein IPN89_18480 [Saprospiraceae bacterium]|nr:hypothetical protein [Saprospiraceae bacterium]